MANRPPLWVVVKRSWLTTLIGTVLVVVALAVMFDNERSAVGVTHALDDGYRYTQYVSVTRDGALNPVLEISYFCLNISTRVF